MTPSAPLPIRASIRASIRAFARKALVLAALLAPAALPAVAEAAPGIPRPDTAVVAAIQPVNYGYGYGGRGYRRDYYRAPPRAHYYRRPAYGYGYGYGYPPPRPRHYGYYRPRNHYYR